MEIKPDEIASILRERIEGLETEGADLAEVGTVLSVADGIARVHGLDNCMSLDMLELPAELALELLPGRNLHQLRWFWAVEVRVSPRQPVRPIDCP